MTVLDSLARRGRGHRGSHRAISTSWLPTGLIATLLWGAVWSPLPAIAQPLQPPFRLSQQSPINAQFVYVNPVLGQDVPEAGGSEARAYRSITYAIAQSANLPQVVIQLAPGTYTVDSGEVFPLRTRSGLILQGDQPNKGTTTRIIGGGNFVSPTFARQNITILAASDSQVRGVGVTNPYTRGTGIWVESTNPTIQNNTFIDNNREGVFVTGRGDPTIQDNVFTRNTGNGVSVAQTSTGTIAGNVFDNTGFGIAVSQTASPRITNNRIINNQDGVVVSNAARPILRRNVIESNRRDGIVAIADARPDLGVLDDPGENRIQNNGRYDINNATTSQRIPAVGNQIATGRIQGDVDFVARPVEVGGNFSDVGGHWAEAYINALAARGIVSGFPDGTFRPRDPVTRVQFAAIIRQAFNPPAERGGFTFVDVSQSFWGYGAIQTAYQGGFMSGYPGGRFQPNVQIPRVQVLVALASGLNYGSTDTAVLSVYRDQGQIPSYAIAGVAAATRQGIVVSYPDAALLNPNQTASRAEVAAFVYQALVSAGEAEPIDSPYIVRGR